MRVAMVSEHASPLAVLGGADAGGQNVHVAALASALSRLGADVTVYTRREDPKISKHVKFIDGVTVTHVDAGPPEVLPKDDLYRHMPEFAKLLWREWGAMMPDVVHAHFWMSGIASIAAARFARIPVVQTFHALGVEKRRHQGAKDTSPKQRLAEEKGIVRAAQRILATATAEVFELTRMGAVPAQIQVIPCGVDLARFTPDGPAEKRTSGVHRLLSLGRMVERKGIAEVIEALTLLPNTELIVVGGPALNELPKDAEYVRLSSIARELGVANRVQFRGRVQHVDVPSIIRSADVVVCTPWYEPFGIVPLEAMACAVPVVASSVGGLIDTVVDGRTGRHVPPRSPVALAETLRRLLADEPLRRAFGRAGRRRAELRYGWNRIGQQTLRSYQEVVELYHRPPHKAARPRRSGA